MKNNIILLGMMGAGKSTVGKLLGDSLSNFTLIDLDEYIESKENMKISEIFEKFGESHFRALETNAIRALSNNENQIIALGGGAFENEANRSLLTKNGITIYLKASSSELFNRIKLQTHRPLLKTGFSENEVKQILKKRERNYNTAKIIVDTDSKPLYNIVDEILERIKNVF